VNFKIEFEQEEDGRWIAEIAELPGVMAYGATQSEAEAAVEALALRVIADRVEAAKIGRKQSPSLRCEQVAKFES
jgi:predicted RNase H-like HicB family nuclease